MLIKEELFRSGIVTSVKTSLQNRPVMKFDPTPLIPATMLIRANIHSPLYLPMAKLNREVQV